MIKVNTCHIQELPLELKGTESPEVLGELPCGAVPEGDIRYDFKASMAGQDLLVRGSVEVTIHAECARCLADIRRTIRVEDVCIMVENCPDREVDITPQVCEELLLAMPVRFLCAEDCRGLCPGCGANLNREKCTCTRKKKNEKTSSGPSPWDVLDQLQ